MARRRFFVDEILSGRAQIEGEEAHHLTRVLRVEPGQRFEISDNRGVFLGEVETAQKGRVSFKILEPVPPASGAVRVSLFASLIRFERFEWLIEKATELGVEAITPVQAERSEKGLSQAATKRVSRWRKIGHEASEQSRRDHLPEINAPVTLAEALRWEGAYRFVLDEHPEATSLIRALPAQANAQERLSLLAGPEGGWTDRERSAMADQNWTGVSLGKSILRTETAVVAGLAIVTAAVRLVF